MWFEIKEREYREMKDEITRLRLLNEVLRLKDRTRISETSLWRFILLKFRI